MAESGWHDPVYEMLDKRLIAQGVRGVLTGGWNLAEMPEPHASDPARGKLPYGMVEPTAVRDQKFSNKTKYAMVEFVFEIHAKTFRELDKIICPAVTAALQHAAVQPDGALRVTMIRPGDIEYEKVEQIWTARMEFVVQANQPAAGTTA